MSAQRFCRRARLTCRLVDLRYGELSVLRAFPVLIVPVPERGPLHERRFVPAAARLLAAYRLLPGTSVFMSSDPSLRVVFSALRRTGNGPYVTGADGSFAEDPASGAGFLSLVNYDARAQAYARIVLRSSGGRAVLSHVMVAARSAVLLPVRVPLRFYDGRFGAHDRFSATCPIVAIARQTSRDTLRNAMHGDDATPTLVFSFPPTARDCGFSAVIAGRAISYALPPGTTQISLDGHGRVTSDTGMPHEFARFAPAPHAGVARGTLPIRSDVLAFEPAHPRVGADAARAYAADVYRDGEGALVLENERVRVIVSPNAGARAFVFEDKARRTNVFTTVGALRDDVLIAPPLSTVDRIAKYTNQMPAGFFNRPYRSEILESGARAVVRFSYAAPDAYPQGARFERTLSLAPHARCFSADLRNGFVGTGDLARKQRAGLRHLARRRRRARAARTARDRSRSAARGARGRDAARPSACARALRYGVARARARGVERLARADNARRADRFAARAHRANPRRDDAPRLRVRARSDRSCCNGAHASIRRDRLRRGARLMAKGSFPVARSKEPDGEVAERSTRPPQKRLSLRSCGFESHLP